MVVQAKRAWLTFDMNRNVARVYLENAEISGGSRHDDVVIINNRILEIDIPDKSDAGLDKRIQELTTREMVRGEAECRRLLARERRRQAILAAFSVASGHPERIDWSAVQQAFVNQGYWTRKLCEYETEKQLRVAQAFGSLLFVVLGAPVGILFARRDFLSAFITCFVPIILAYYPLMLLGINMGKEDILDPVLALWSGNLLLAILAGFVIKPVLRH
jgi:lipopolysaccharide export system permease protein